MAKEVIKRLGIDEDKPQRVYMTVTEPGANAGIVQAFPTTIQTRDPVGLLVDELWMSPGPPSDLFSADTLGLFYGLTQLWNNGVVPSPSTGSDFQGVIHGAFRQRMDSAAAAASFFIEDGLYKERFPEGILVHPAALYAFLQGVNQAGALEAVFILQFRYKALTDKEYQDILQGIITANSI